MLRLVQTLPNSRDTFKGRYCVPHPSKCCRDLLITLLPFEVGALAVYAAGLVLKTFVADTNLAHKLYYCIKSGGVMFLHDRVF